MESFAWKNETPPFSFRYGGVHSREFIAQWRRSENREHETPPLTPGDKSCHIVYKDTQTGLNISVTIREMPSFRAFEWVLELQNTGSLDTPIIEDILPLDISLACCDTEQVFLHHAKGASSRIDDFMPVTEHLPARKQVVLKPVGGRSSSGQMPFMNLQGKDKGMVLAIGWSGQWMSLFHRPENALSVKAGMEKTRLFLTPGEKIRTPRILVINWEGADHMTGNNILRQVMLKYYSPREKSGPAIPPVSHMTQYCAYYKTKKTSQETELKALDRSAMIGAEAYWIDACWFGAGGHWVKEGGNWEVRKDFFPNGLRPVSEAAHKAGMKFILWFEPERVGRETALAREHPEFLLQHENGKGHALLNLGNNEAREHITDIISKVISESGVDIYRQDLCFNILPYWQASDKPDRTGMTEIRHIEGLYMMWDELRRRHPGLLIDNCCGGGRRIDIETASRSFVLWRSDFSDVGGPRQGKNLHIGDQSQTAGLSRWIPLHSAAVWTFTPYSFRSAMAAGIVIYCDIRTEDFPLETAVKAVKELKRLRPYYLGSFYPLTSLNTEPDNWCCYQYHRDDLSSGFAVFLRRHESPFPVIEPCLKEIDINAEYRVGIAWNFDDPPRKTMKGKELASIRITIPEKPGSALLLYSKK